MTKPNEVRVNERIRVPMVRVISSDGSQLGVMAISEALRLAHQQNFDLVEVAPTARPPVCRIMDFGKFKYEQSKHEREARKKQHIYQIKEVKVRPKIEEHDYDFKVRNARKFLLQRDKVKFTCMFRGRELSHAELGAALLDRIVADLADVGFVENRPVLEGRNMVMVVAPRKDLKPPKPGTEPEEAHASGSPSGGDGGAPAVERGGGAA